MSDKGTYVEHEGRPAVRFVRVYRHAIERVWSAVTEPRELRAWFPSEVRLELRKGAKILFSGDPHTEDLEGEVLECDPPRLFAFTWGEEEVRFELEPLGCAECRFTLIDVLGERAAAARNAAGWEVCAAELAKHLAGEPAGGPHSESAESWQPLYDAYVAAGLPSGAPGPRATRLLTRARSAGLACRSCTGAGPGASWRSPRPRLAAGEDSYKETLAQFRRMHAQLVLGHTSSS